MDNFLAKLMSEVQGAGNAGNGTKNTVIFDPESTLKLLSRSDVKGY